MFLSLLLLSLGGSQAWDPRYKLQVPSEVSVEEGLCVLVPCSFSYPEAMAQADSSLAYGYWFQDETNTDHGIPVASNNPARPAQSRTQGRFQLVGDPHRNNCSLLIRDAQREDSMHYFFRVEKGAKLKYNFRSRKFILQVTALTQTPDIFMPGALESGQAVTIVCVFPWISEQCQAPSISWSGPALSSQGLQPQLSFWSALSLTPRLTDHDTQLTCHVDFRAGVSVQKTVQLRVAYAPRDPVITIFRDNVQESPGNMTFVKGQFLRLLCTADGWPPPTLTWVLGNRVLLRSNVTDPGTLGLDLPRVKAGHAGRYTCRAENRLGSQHRALDLSVQYPPEELRVAASQGNRTELEIHRNGSSLPVLQGQSLRLVCATRSNPPATLSWVRGSQTLSPPWPADPGVLELPVVQVEHEGEFTCRAQNPLGALHISLDLSVHLFSKGVCLGIGATALLSLCLIVVIVKTLRKSWPQAEKPRTQVSRSSTILDYVNVVRTAGAQGRKAKPSSPPRTPTLGTSSPEPRKSPEPKAPRQGPDPENKPEELHYAAISFLRPGEVQRPREEDQKNYAEVRVHRGSPRL
ncbi:sialic acid-binding Ig-like lectin 16 isoform 2-T2 [Thomomys bottae]